MRRINLSMAWLLLLLLPAAASAQSGTVDRSRSRGEASRTGQVDRTSRPRAVEKKAPKARKPERVREDKVSPRKPSTKAKARSSNRDGEYKGRSDVPSVNRSQRKPDKNVTRNNRSNRVKRAPVRNNKVRHAPARRSSPPKMVRHKAGPLKKIARAIHRFDRRPVRRYVYRDRRYHRGGLSIGFYIRIPAIRWHVGHTRRFVYRQVVTGHPTGAVEVQSTFRRKIRSVHHDYVEVEFRLDRIAVTSGGRFIGQVDRFPGDLRRVRAKIYSDGFVEFDRMLYVVGNRLTGFELLSTRYCGGDLIGASYGCLDPRSGELDFYRERVNSTRYSRLLDPVQLGDVVPVALVPDEEYLGFQYVVGYDHASDAYYSGAFDYSSLNSFDSDGTAYRLSDGTDVSGFVSGGRGPVDPRLSSGASGFAHESAVTYQNKSGQTLALQQRAEIRYLGD